MASPLAIFSLGIGTVIGALGVGFGSSYFLITSEPQKQNKVSAVRYEPPPPIVEKVERKEAQIVSEPEPVRRTTAVKSETTGSGSTGWITTPLPEKPAVAVAVPVMPFTEPVSATSAPPSLVASAPSMPIEIALPPAVSAPASIASTPTPQERQPVASARHPAKTHEKSVKAAKHEKKMANREGREKVAVEEKNSRRRVIVERWRERIDDDEDRMRVHASPPSQGLGGIFGILFR